VEIRSKIPRLVVSEKYESSIKWILRAVIAGGIVTSVVAFPWYVGLFVAVVLVIVEQTLERAIFRYASMFVQPLPDFAYDPDEWTGMAFSGPLPDGRRIVAPIFRSEPYARKFLELIRAWNYGEDRDADNNIRLSFIVEDAEQYSIYLYASTERRGISQFKEAVETEARSEKPGREHFQILIGIVFCKMFDYGPESHFERFRQSHPADVPILLTTAHQDGDQVTLLDNPILKSHWKIKGRKELSSDDFELEHGKTIIGIL
jgi:hypothetical protein